VLTPRIETPRPSNRRLFAFLLLIALILGALEGWYGRVRYSGDGIAYLNIVRAIHVGDWRVALNPLWGLGYPFILAVATSIFPATPTAEWKALFVVNLSIFIATFFSFFYLVLTAADTGTLRWIRHDGMAVRYLLLGAFTIFLPIELSMDNVSRIGPDLLISCLVFLASALLLKLKEHAHTRAAIALGAVCGAGFVVKNIFLPLTLAFAALVFLAVKDKKTAIKLSLISLLCAALFVVPYAYGLSWAAGHPTLGESGAINYAWHVNKLQGGAFWQGGPAGYGKPIHPPQVVSIHPHIYLFKEPFAVTFPPFFNPPYYYQGYTHFFSLKAQIRAVGGNLVRLLKLLEKELIVLAFGLCVLLSIGLSYSRRRWFESKSDLWPVLLLGFAGLGMYLLVWLEPRYIASFTSLLLLILLFKLMVEQRASLPLMSPMRRGALFLGILVIGSIGTLLATQQDEDRNVLGNALHDRTFTNSEQWRAGVYLKQIGMMPGDQVAVISDLLSASRCTWAYVDGLKIIGQLNGDLPPNASDDFDVFWHASPEDQRAMLEAFHHAGAKLVFANAKPDRVIAPGWQAIPETPYWIYRF
jgi:hypothetical protein